MRSAIAVHLPIFWEGSRPAERGPRQRLLPPSSPGARQLESDRAVLLVPWQKRLIASGVAVVTHLSKLLLETIASLLDEDVYLRFEPTFSGSSVSRCRITAGAENRRINARTFGGLDVPFAELVFFAADLAAFDLTELALQVGVVLALTIGLERLGLTTHSIVHDVGALAIQDGGYRPGNLRPFSFDRQLPLDQPVQARPIFVCQGCLEGHAVAVLVVPDEHSERDQHYRGDKQQRPHRRGPPRVGSLCPKAAEL
jgi:hypothetical protein